MRGLLPLCLASLIVVATGPALADHCPTDRLAALPGQIAEGSTAIAYGTNPARISVGKPFSIEVVACIGGEKRMAPSRIRVDAGMPMHGHGMNYRPSEKKLGPGHSTFDGMVFHMPGKWQFTFDVFDGDKRQRLTRNVTIGR